MSPSQPLLAGAVPGMNPFPSAGFPFVGAPAECPEEGHRNERGFILPPYNPTYEKFVEPHYSLSSAGVYTPIVPLCTAETHVYTSLSTPGLLGGLNPLSGVMVGSPIHGRSRMHGLSSRNNFMPLTAELDASHVDKLWPGGEFRYRWHPSIDSTMKSYFQMAMVNISARSSSTFLNVQNANEGVALLRSDQGCQSITGYNGPNSAPTDVSCGPVCGTAGTCMHEILHSLGLQHAHSDRYRDDFIRVMLENVQPDAIDQFEKLTAPEFDDPGRYNEMYAYDSIMHYSRAAFSASDADTIVCEDPQYQDVIGQRARISPHDIINLEKLYSASARYAYSNVKNNYGKILQVGKINLHF
jgi:hypothetical protein